MKGIKLQMTNEKFCDIAKDYIRQYVLDHLDKTDGVPYFDVYIVWNAYVLGNIKALLSTTLCDGMYYEITYNNISDEIYFDAYKKFENRVVKK